MHQNGITPGYYNIQMTLGLSFGCYCSSETGIRHTRSIKRI